MKRGKKRALLTGVTLAVIAGLAAGWMLIAGAVWREEEAVQINPDDIESSTLAVGAHLIHLSALTDSLYEIAQDSAGNSGQMQVYYKSELADGTWFDITTATTLADITTGGNPVDKSVIAGLFFTHHTKSDGVTYDLRTGQPVSLNDIIDPYDLESLEELFPLKTHYETLKESQDEEAPANVARIAEFFATQVENEDTALCDVQLDALQVYYNILRDNDAGSTELDAVQKVLDAVDAGRRAYVFRTLEAELTEYAQELMGVPASEMEGAEEGAETEAPKASTDTSLQSAVNDSLSNVKNSLIEYEGKMLDPGTTVLSQTYYTLASQLVSDAQLSDYAACDTDVNQLICLDNIKGGVVSRKAGELALLDDVLLPGGTSTYTSALQAGVSAEYTSAVAQQAAQVQLNSITNANTSTLNIARNELEFLITARGQRVENEAAMTYLEQRLEETNGWYALVPEDAFQAGANSTIDQHVTFLTDQHRQLELAAGGNEMDALVLEKAELQTQLMSALDDDDLARAKALEEAIAAIDEQIDALQDSGMAMSDGTLGAAVAELKSNAMKLLNDTELDADELATLEGIVDTLGEMVTMDYGLVFPVLQELYKAMAAKQALEGTELFADAMASIEDTVANHAEAYAAALRTEKNRSDLEQLTEDFFAESAPSLLNIGSDSGASDLAWDEQGAVYLAALQMYYDETGSDAAGELIASVARRQAELGNPLAFLCYRDGNYEYLPLTALKRITGMRYVWNENKSMGVLAEGGSYYGFTAYSDIVIRGRTGQENVQMERPAVYQNGIHVYEGYTAGEFGAEALYLSGTDYGVLLSAELREQAEALFALFLA